MSKLYFEKYAQLTLGLTSLGDSFEISDKPDLQDCEHDVGIEVVCVETPEEGLRRSVWNQYAGEGLNSNEFREKFKRQDFQQAVIPDLDYMAMDVRSGNAKDLIPEMLDFIRRKNDKSVAYKRFKRNGLCLYNCHIWSEQIDELQQAISNEDFMFDFYIESMSTKLYILSKKEKLEEHDISFDLSRKFKCEALEYEKITNNEILLYYFFLFYHVDFVSHINYYKNKDI